MSFWAQLRDEKRRALISWVAGGLAAVLAGGWAVVTYLWPNGDGKSVCAQQGVAIGGNVSGSSISNSVSNGTVSVPCEPKGK